MLNIVIVLINDIICQLISLFTIYSLVINATVTPTDVIRLNTPPYDMFSLNCVIDITPPTYNTDSIIFSWPQEENMKLEML